MLTVSQALESEGIDRPEDGLSSPVNGFNTPFWKSDSELSKILLNAIECLGHMEGESNDAQEANAECLVQEDFLPFVDVYPAGYPTQIAFEPAVNLLRSYLHVVRLSGIYYMGKEVRVRSSSITIPRSFTNC